MLNSAFLLFLAAAAGVSIVVQQALNANLRAEIGSAAPLNLERRLSGANRAIRDALQYFRF